MRLRSNLWRLITCALVNLLSLQGVRSLSRNSLIFRYGLGKFGRSGSCTVRTGISCHNWRCRLAVPRSRDCSCFSGFESL